MALPENYQGVVDQVLREALPPANLGAEVSATGECSASSESVPPTWPSAPLLTPAGLPRAPFEPSLRVAYVGMAVRYPATTPNVLLDSTVQCAVVWDSHTETPTLYWAAELEQLIEHLEKADVVVSYGGNEFDFKVVTAKTKRAVTLKTHIDLKEMLVMEFARLGKAWQPQGVVDFVLGTFRDTSLVGLNERTYAMTEGELMNYLLRVVVSMRDLTTFARWNGYVMALDGEETPLRLPEWFKFRRKGA